jgi:hypothetical protein
METGHKQRMKRAQLCRQRNAVLPPSPTAWLIRRRPTEDAYTLGCPLWAQIYTLQPKPICFGDFNVCIQAPPCFGLPAASEGTYHSQHLRFRPAISTSRCPVISPADRHMGNIFITIPRRFLGRPSITRARLKCSAADNGGQCN